jgi:PAS domain S-box-containing protein
MSYPVLTRWIARPKISAALGYGLAVVSVAAALAVTLVFLRFDLPLPFTSFALTAIALTFWYSGTKPGIVALLLAMMARSYFFEPRTNALSRVLYELVFVIFALLMSWVRRSRNVLEVGLTERTAKLTEMNQSLQTEIAERNQAEHELRRQKEHLDGLFELAPEAVILTDENFNVLRVNKEFTQMFGYAPDEAVGRWLPDLIVPEELQAAAVQNRSRVDSGEKVYIEAVRRRKDGVRLDVSVAAARVSLAPGQIAVYLIYRDITERKRADEKLRRSEAYLLDAQRLSRTGSWTHDMSSGKVTITPEVHRIYGIRPDEDPSTAEFFFSRIHPEDWPVFKETYRDIQREKSDFKAHFRIVLPDGTLKHIYNIAHPTLSESGEVVEFVGTAMDVTEQWEARTKLEQAFEEIKRLKDQLHGENLALREQIDEAFMFEEIVGSSPALQGVLSGIVKVAPTDSTVLITGETGTGKELIARAIHKRSQRAGQAFISVNCASTPASLISSELFGHEKGAFTGALQRRQGRFELAHSGTIFLDEVGELPAEAQIALLRVLQERQFERLGGSQLHSTDVRVIAATNRDLPAAIADGIFRSDLFYRLNVFPIEVPPLRQRTEDIPMLVEYFAKRYAEKAGKQIRTIDKATLERCRAYPWPGNIRELQNIVERSVILCTGATFWIDEAWLSSQEPPQPELPSHLTETLQNQEKEIIEAALSESKGKVAGPRGAATRLGIPRSTLDWKIKQLKIKKDKFRSES